MLSSVPALEIVNKEIIPALDTVGKGFENKTVYLPQLLMSAEAAKSAFEVIKNSMAGSEKSQNNSTFVIATVKGDIHDIGKNIVKLYSKTTVLMLLTWARMSHPKKLWKRL